MFRLRSTLYALAMLHLCSLRHCAEFDAIRDIADHRNASRVLRGTWKYEQETEHTDDIERPKSAQQTKKDCRVEAVFVDIRDAPQALPVLRSVLEYVEKPCITIVAFDANYKWAKKLASSLESLNYHMGTSLVDIRVELYGREYVLRGLQKGVRRERVQIGKVLESARFWETRIAEFVLIVQTDSFLCRELDISKYENYSYIGAPWGESVRSCHVGRTMENWNAPAIKAGLDPPLGKHHGCVIQGNGGFSLRNVEWMLNAIRACPTPFSGTHSESMCSAKGVMEDEYFSATLYGLGAPMPTQETAWYFSQETPKGCPKNVDPDCKAIPVGVHKVWRYRGSEELERYRQGCKYFDEVYPL